MSQLLSSPALRRALLEAVMVGALGGVIGVHIVLRRLPFPTMALTHATFPGVVIASLWGIDLLLGGALFGLGLIALLVAAGRHRRLDQSTTVGVLLAGGLAMGVLLISTREGFSRDLSAFLVGSIVTVDGTDLWSTAAVGLAVMGVLALLHRNLVAAAFDPVGARALGVPVVALEVVMLVVVQLTIVVTVPAIGTILAVALLVGPAATARLWVDRVGSSMAVAAAIGAACGVIGLWLSLVWDLAAGGAIAVVVGLAFGMSLAGGAVRRAVSIRRRPTPPPHDDANPARTAPACA